MVVLKGLLEDGQLLLQDGRKILSPKHFNDGAAAAAAAAGEDIILVHPDFRLFVLVVVLKTVVPIS